MQSIFLILAAIGLIAAVAFAGTTQRDKAAVQREAALKADRLAAAERELLTVGERMRVEIESRNRRISEDQATIEKLLKEKSQVDREKDAGDRRSQAWEHQSRSVTQLLKQGCSLYADWAFVSDEAKRGNVTAVEVAKENDQVAVQLANGFWVNCWLTDTKKMDPATLKVTATASAVDRLPARIAGK